MKHVVPGRHNTAELRLNFEADTSENDASRV